MACGIFVTGTDTAVGKTHVTALLLAEMRRCGVAAAGFKPIACGADGRADARCYWRLMRREVPLDLINPIYLRYPLAPAVAARLERRRIRCGRIFECQRQLLQRYSVVLAEGAGGLLVPITNRYFVVDLARDMGWPVLVVSRLGLGTINHTLLTVRQAQAAGLKVCGVVLNDTTGRAGWAERINPKSVAAFCDVPVLGVIPYRREPSREVLARLINQLLVAAGSFGRKQRCKAVV